MARHVRSAAAAGAIAGYLALQWLGRSYGATSTERRRRLPGDDLMAAPMAETTHAITVDAPPERIWPWLMQMGWHRGAWYTAAWVDRLLFPANGPSADRIIPEFQQLAAGDHIPDGPPEANCEFTVAQLEPGHHLVLHSAEHLPPGWKERFGAWIDWTWAFVLDDLGGGKTRFIFRSRGRAGPWWVAAAYLLVIIPADFVMSRQMLRGVKTRAERTTAADLQAATAAQPHGRRATHGTPPGLTMAGMTPRSSFTPDEARAAGEQIGIDWGSAPFDLEQFRMGMDVELEHGARDPQTNVTGDDVIMTAKIARAHLNEFPDYYTRLAKMEAEAEADTQGD